MKSATRVSFVVFAFFMAALAVAGVAGAQNPPAPQNSAAALQAPPMIDPEAELSGVLSALVRLPLACALGAALALRPRRKGTPARTTAVVQTQILLSVVGSVIMLVVGASLARAFGIVGAANLIRYRSKIDDPKDAVVMLCALSVGLAAGVGLYLLAIFSTAFIAVALWVIESFEPQSEKHFMLSINAGEETDELRKQVEAVLRRHNLTWELRKIADDQIGYDVKMPSDMKTDGISKAIAGLDSKGHIGIEWDEKKKKDK